MQQWQYKTVKVGAEGMLGGIANVKAIDEQLNEHGSAGWELVAAFDTNLHEGASREFVFVLKRPLA